LGTAHAFGCAKNFANNESVLFMYGDLLVEPKVYQKGLLEVRNYFY
jgi:UTP-glucose-1-phosphate uridylyltransferase